MRYSKIGIGINDSDVRTIVMELIWSVNLENSYEYSNIIDIIIFDPKAIFPIRKQSKPLLPPFKTVLAYI
ncbi:MAG: hypothetical protein FWC09_11295 [Lachnospiraceae bacterium]|nr:hypothetical protein [Lachnospiraceae bacterium]